MGVSGVENEFFLALLLRALSEFRCVLHNENKGQRELDWGADQAGIQPPVLYGGMPALTYFRLCAFPEWIQTCTSEHECGGDWEEEGKRKSSHHQREMVQPCPSKRTAAPGTWSYFWWICITSTFTQNVWCHTMDKRTRSDHSLTCLLPIYTTVEKENHLRRSLLCTGLRRFWRDCFQTTDWNTLCSSLTLLLRYNDRQKSPNISLDAPIPNFTAMPQSFSGLSSSSWTIL